MGDITAHLGRLTATGFEVFRPAGTYFVTADIRPLGFDDGYAFCRSLPARCVGESGVRSAGHASSRARTS